MALRLTVQVQLVLQALLRNPAREVCGLELPEETIGPRAEKRPARRYYRLTAGGAALRRLAEGGGTA